MTGDYNAAYIRPRLKIPLGSKACFTRCCTASRAGGKGWKRSSPAQPRNNQAWPPACSTALRTVAASAEVFNQRSAPPHSSRLSPASASGGKAGGKDSRHGGTIDDFAAELPVGALHRRRRAGQSHIQHAIYETGGRHRQWPARPAIHLRNRRGGSARLDESQFITWPRQHLEAHFQNHAQRAHRAGHQPRHIITCDVLHHLAAELLHLAAAVDDFHAQHEIARRARIRAARPRQTAGYRSAQSRAIAEMRRLEREDLLVLVQRGFDFRQRRTRTRRDHQFRRLIMNDTAMTTGVQRFSHGRTAEKSLGIAADDAERRRTRERIAHLCLESLRLISVHARAIVLG